MPNTLWYSNRILYDLTACLSMWLLLAAHKIHHHHWLSALGQVSGTHFLHLSLSPAILFISTYPSLFFYKARVFNNTDNFLISGYDIIFVSEKLLLYIFIFMVRTFDKYLITFYNDLPHSEANIRACLN